MEVVSTFKGHVPITGKYAQVIEAFCDLPDGKVLKIVTRNKSFGYNACRAVRRHLEKIESPTDVEMTREFDMTNLSFVCLFKKKEMEA